MIAHSFPFDRMFAWLTSVFTCDLTSNYDWLIGVLFDSSIFFQVLRREGGKKTPEIPIHMRKLINFENKAFYLQNEKDYGKQNVFVSKLSSNVSELQLL